jgi:predicted kinase
MLNICARCGLYRPDKIIDAAGPYAVCPDCGHKHEFRLLPLLIISGANGAGKSTVCRELVGHLTGAVLLDCDMLWRPEFAAPNAREPNFFETWLRVAKNIGQSGHPVVLFGSGVGVPGNIERCVERRYFTNVFYLALVCSDDVLSIRLRSRPAWREAHTDEYIQTQLRFNGWFKERSSNLSPTIDVLDTSTSPVETTVAQVRAWIHEGATLS